MCSKVMLIGLYIAPGAAFHSTEPGWFRLMYADTPDILHIALNRFQSFVLAKERARNQEL